ncbi:NAD-dependent epimerase/dehydratase family protein [Nannocystis bainbridge]|uniref:NAD-dependent epimerase/dehydratase family protein n=1 Tax=Nannocystis bainbridge TaxID=2995303 RepID=A0ABT5E223_9BACT|nr:NAD-dependent epimerase/dehydratase family protein [Nannocystis bainbridge]MDC0719013.1 NAD-dependent epimerase/dehydratase family protein [Nannocystis bainbridge]
MPTRRRFLALSAALSAAACGPRPAVVAPDSPARPLDLLVLGGTGFIGPHLVRHAVARGHRVTIFTRGRRQAELPAGVERLTGDRDGQLEALVGRRWDIVVDDSATRPEWVRQSAQLLKDQVGRYLYTSSTGVYYPYLRAGADEAWPVRLEATDPADGSEAYGVAKARSEREVLQAFGERGLVVRPTYIVGPGDTTDRFPYWPVRLQRGGDVLAPGRPGDPVQLIDVRDLAEFMLRLLEDGRSGIYNAVGPREPMTMPQFLAAAQAAVNPEARLVWVDDYAFLEAHGISDAVPWVMLKGNDLGHMSTRNARAVAAGLRFRPLAETVRDTLAWWPTVPAERRDAPEFAITPEQEAKALADWRARG